MPENIRALIFVLALAVPAFYVNRQIASSVIAPREFVLWRNTWFVATIAAFLSGNFFIFAGIMAMICLYVRAESVAIFFMLLFAVPLVESPIGGFGLFNKLFELSNPRLLVILLLLPMLFATGKPTGRSGRAYATADWLIVGYVLLLFAVSVSAEITQALRQATLLTLDVLIPYFALSRAITGMADIRKALLAFVIGVVPLSLIGVLETLKHWLLYNPIAADWGEAEQTINYLPRGELLRATATAFSPIVFGFIILVAIGCMLALWPSIRSRRFSGIALAILAGGLVAALSRGPWVGTAVLIIVYLALSPNAIANLAKFLVIGGVVLGFLVVSPLGDRVLDFLPFVGSIDSANVDYRQRLFTASISVIERNPWLGNIHFRQEPEMQQLMQGEHIVDVVNTFLNVALRTGLVGLALFLAFFAAILIGLWRVRKFPVIRQAGLAGFPRALMATLIGMMVTMGTVSFIDFIPYVCWSFAGLCVAFIRIAYRERGVVPRAVVVSHVTG
jgi:O-antigen ligase